MLGLPERRATPNKCFERAFQNTIIISTLSIELLKNIWVKLDNLMRRSNYMCKSGKNHLIKTEDYQ